LRPMYYNSEISGGSSAPSAGGFSAARFPCRVRRVGCGAARRARVSITQARVRATRSGRDARRWAAFPRNNRESPRALRRLVLLGSSVFERRFVMSAYSTSTSPRSSKTGKSVFVVSLPFEAWSGVGGSLASFEAFEGCTCSSVADVGRRELAGRVLRRRYRVAGSASDSFEFSQPI